MAKPQNTGKKTSKKELQRQAARRRDRLRKLRAWSIVGVVVLAIAGAIVWGEVTKETGETDPAAWNLPAFGPTAERQDRVALADFEGKPTVVNFFASWCVECDRELPGFRNVWTEFGEEINFVGIASQENGDPMTMPSRHDVTEWPLARDVGGRNRSGLSEALGARGMPLTAFYDAEGNFLNVQLGSITEQQLRAIVAQLYGIDA